MELIIPVQTDLLEEVIRSRTKNSVYETNKKIKFVAAYYILKSLTTSGVIKNYPAQISQLCFTLKCTEPTFYKLLRNCEKLGYLRYSAKSIVLASYSGFADTFDAVATNFTRIKYDCTKQKFHVCLESAYLQLRERRRGEVFEHKIKALPELIEDLKTVVSPDAHGNYGSALQQMQIQAFKYGHEKLQSIFYLNPFTTCNSKTMAKMFKFKSEQSVAYLKYKLQKNFLAKTSAQRVPSQSTQRLKKKFIEWDQTTKQTIWVLPDKLEYAPILQT